ncbi:MAG: hypothetical protein CMK74_21015 [Pseudomonadales bacterium]|nr:hypothetical protein [Pseudomonadales bacterium]|tara:strand:+ start:93 stop:362 length:270 start_codon:yes stop_codon:yes gene_type:complete
MASKDTSLKDTFIADALIAEKASMVTNMAYMHAKAKSLTVVISKGDYIVEERSDGTEVRLAKSKRHAVKAGEAINIRSMMGMSVLNGRS